MTTNATPDLPSANALIGRLTAAAEAWIDADREDWLKMRGIDQPQAAETAWDFERANFLGPVKLRIEHWAQRVPPLFRGADLACLAPAQGREQVTGYLPGPARNLILAGPVGTGKSYAAWAVAHQATAMDLRAVVYSTPRLMLDMRPDNDPQAFHRACSAQLLILDDLGAARPTDWAVEQMFSIADERMNQMRRTVITTNASWEALVAFWGQPTMDRFRDRAVPVTLGGDSRRGRP